MELQERVRGTPRAGDRERGEDEPRAAPSPRKPHSPGAPEVPSASPRVPHEQSQRMPGAGRPPPLPQPSSHPWLTRGERGWRREKGQAPYPPCRGPWGWKEGRGAPELQGVACAGPVIPRPSETAFLLGGGRVASPCLGSKESNCFPFVSLLSSDGFDKPLTVDDSYSTVLCLKFSLWHREGSSRREGCEPK